MVRQRLWLVAAISETRRLVQQGRALFTLKALRELAALDVGLDERDACTVLIALTAAEFDKRLRSEATGEWLYVFKPHVGGTTIYLKLILRWNCVVVSFHEDNDDQDLS